MKDLLNNTIKYTFAFIFFIIFILLIIVDTKIKYNYINLSKISNIIILLIILLIFLIFYYLNRKIKNKININEKKVIKIIFISLFIIQIIIFKNIYFETGWDVKLLRETAINYSITNIFTNNYHYDLYPYFDIYPNNIFLTSIFSYIIKFGYLINITNPNKLLVLINILLIDLTGIITLKTIKNFSDNKKTIIISAILYSLFIGLSPWFLIPYSDTYSIIFPISILYNYTKKNKKKYNYFLIGLLSIIGYLIKPTNIIVLIAIVIIEAINFIFTKKKEIKENIKKITPVIVGILIAILINKINLYIIDYKPNKEYQFTFYHYLMMGSNEKTTGGYNEKDFFNSVGKNSYKERIKYNKEIFIKRMKEKNINEHINFYKKKLLLIYNDGSLAWGKEGQFYFFIENNYNLLSNYLKNIFYNDGEYYSIFSTITQMIWLIIISFSLISSIINKNKDLNVMYLTIIGLTLFLLLFEARARYLYLYIPYFIVLATLGMEKLSLLLNKKIYR